MSCSRTSCSRASVLAGFTTGIDSGSGWIAVRKIHARGRCRNELPHGIFARRAATLGGAPAKAAVRVSILASARGREGAGSAMISGDGDSRIQSRLPRSMRRPSSRLYPRASAGRGEDSTHVSCPCFRSLRLLALLVGRDHHHAPVTYAAFGGCMAQRSAKYLTLAPVSAAQRGHLPRAERKPSRWA